jgi:hypothetical protein
MNVIAGLSLSQSEQGELAQILGVNEEELPAALTTYASAALLEYVTMFLGQKVFRRGSDLQEYRLLLLIDKVFDSMIPDEEDVCRLFQTTSAESRALIRRVMSKYQYQLKTAIDNTVKRVVEAASQDGEGDPYTVTINSSNVVEGLNRLLADIDGALQPVTKKRGSVSTFEISPASHARLKERLGL